MKKYIFLLLIMSALGLVSCEDYLTHDHPTAVSDDEWWNTESDAAAALYRVYVGIPDGANGRQLQFLSGLSDDMVPRQSSRGEFEAYTKGLQSASWDVALQIWTADYKCIRRAARFLENVDNVYMDEELKSRYKWEAKALRAYYHMELMMLYGGVPIVTTALTPNESQVARNTEQEVYDFVIEELMQCAVNLPSEYNYSERWRMTSGICWALISRLSLYKGDYDLAKQASLELINSGNYNLYPNYRDLFTYTGEMNNESIFFKEGGSAYAWVAFAPQGVGGKTVLSPTASLVNTFETKQGKTIQELGQDSLQIYMASPNYNNNRDPRLQASVLWNGREFSSNVLEPFNPNPNNNDRISIQNSTSTGYWCYKYVTEEDRTGARTLDYMILRYAEVLLTYVEALIETGDWQNPDVITYINAIRNRAGMPDVDTQIYNTQEKLRELVRRERRVELAFEAVRFWDIRRWNILEDVMNGPVYGAVDPATGEPFYVEDRLARNNRDYLWPIPQAEILANPNMEQNPNY
ncbi:RagB/SusD family nutrient uptake outer membrane protein [Mangrovimonas sp. YM274]|uniref:RagB/SusD family nutrient uptake outer membrane protein n=1 Tax=Mangrovimonas sp. YM274 TaxID=3070660 RepID=UPI0027DD4466|nr:RagB/SusD family nutrient uptake outer membrane protein [Mangrovimonas sp. YM274]WMI68154.1 RagB/SusD family nutrient uptake outer membrane protein [Mangrovimonas sp. YM274]